eukprot:1158111-Pelagomonas_calceolata.AAC.5
MWRLALYADPCTCCHHTHEHMRHAAILQLASPKRRAQMRRWTNPPAAVQPAVLIAWPQGLVLLVAGAIAGPPCVCPAKWVARWGAPFVPQVR